MYSYLGTYYYEAVHKYLHIKTREEDETLQHCS